MAKIGEIFTSAGFGTLTFSPTLKIFTSPRSGTLTFNSKISHLPFAKKKEEERRRTFLMLAIFHCKL